MMKLRRFAPSTAGRLRRKEYFFAKVRSRPVAMPAVMVVPERERPGITASAWPQPTIKASATVAFLAVLWPRAMRSEKNRINPVASRAQETMMELENSWLIFSFPVWRNPVLSISE